MALQLSPFLTSKPMKSLSFMLPPIADRSLGSPKFMSSGLRSGTTKEVEYVKQPSIPRREAHVQVTHSMPPEEIEIFKSMEDWVEKNVLVHLKRIDNCWQPQDFLPDAASDGFEEQVRELRERAREIPDDYFIALVGSMITEEALPAYQIMLNTLDRVRDETASSLTPWAIWTRVWTAEENRNGDLMNKYLYLSGRVDMQRIEKTKMSIYLYHAPSNHLNSGTGTNHPTKDRFTAAGARENCEFLIMTFFGSTSFYRSLVRLAMTDAPGKRQAKTLS